MLWAAYVRPQHPTPQFIERIPIKVNVFDAAVKTTLYPYFVIYAGGEYTRISAMKRSPVFLPQTMILLDSPISFQRSPFQDLLNFLARHRWIVVKLLVCHILVDYCLGSNDNFDHRPAVAGRSFYMSVGVFLHRHRNISSTNENAVVLAMIKDTLYICERLRQFLGRLNITRTDPDVFAAAWTREYLWTA